MKNAPTLATPRAARGAIFTTSLLCLALFASGCTTTQRLRPAETAFNAASVVRPGDTVTCTMKDGTESVFKVVSATPTEIRGETQTVNVSEVARLEAKRFSAVKTTALSAGIFTLFLLGSAAAALGSFMGAPM